MGYFYQYQENSTKLKYLLRNNKDIMKVWGLGQISPEEKSDILNKHKHLYDGYKTLYPDVPNTQPLYVQDFANDKEGLVVTNKGDVKKYTNFGINEQVESKEVCDECGAMEMSEGSGMCSECGGMMYEGECSECGWKGGDVMEYEEMDEDIYDIEDLNPEEGFDYLEPKASNKINAYRYKKEMDEQGDYVDPVEMEPAYNFTSNGPNAGGDAYPVNEEGDYNFEDFHSAWEDDMDEELDEVDVSGSQGIYGSMKPAYDFDSEGPGKAGPYQRFSNEGEDMEDEDLGTLEDDWDEISNAGDDTEDWNELDDELKESFIYQKRKISEMMNRMERF